MPRLRTGIEALIEREIQREGARDPDRDPYCGVRPALVLQGHSLREISRSLALSRNTVRRIQPSAEPNRRRSGALRRSDAGRGRRPPSRPGARQWSASRNNPSPTTVSRCATRSTLTRWAEAGRPCAVRRGAPARPRLRARTGDAATASPHRVLFAKAGTPGSIVTVQCAGLVLAYSRRLFIQYLPAVHSLRGQSIPAPGGSRFMDGVCPVCHHRRIAAASCSPPAPAPMPSSPRRCCALPALGFPIPRTRRVGHPDQKGRIERPLLMSRTTSLAARDFEDFDVALIRRECSPGAATSPITSQSQGARHVGGSGLSHREASPLRSRCRCPAAS